MCMCICMCLHTHHTQNISYGILRLNGNEICGIALRISHARRLEIEKLLSKALLCMRRACPYTSLVPRPLPAFQRNATKAGGPGR